MNPSQIFAAGTLHTTTQTHDCQADTLPRIQSNVAFLKSLSNCSHTQLCELMAECLCNDAHRVHGGACDSQWEEMQYAAFSYV